MTIDELNRAWYSESKVKQINIPKLYQWRSRYDLKEELLLNDYTLVKRNMKVTDMTPIRSSSDMYHIVTAAENHRPDLVAYQQYGDPRLAWVILAANGLSDIFDFVTDLEIIIPSATSLYTSGGVLAK